MGQRKFLIYATNQVDLIRNKWEHMYHQKQVLKEHALLPGYRTPWMSFLFSNTNIIPSVRKAFLLVYMSLIMIAESINHFLLKYLQMYLGILSLMSRKYFNLASQTTMPHPCKHSATWSMQRRWILEMHFELSIRMR